MNIMKKKEIGTSIHEFKFNQLMSKKYIVEKIYIKEEK